MNVTNLFSLQEQKADISRFFDSYINSGGFCETFNLSETQISVYRESLIEKIILKDIISRYGINRPELLRNLYLYISKNTGSCLSFLSLSKEMGVDDKTVSSYLQYLSNSFIISRIDKQEWKSKRIFNTQKKYYMADTLFTNASFESRSFENIVYTHLTERYGSQNIFFMKNEKDHEVDFIVNLDGIFECYQVCHSLNNKNIRRELRSLHYLMKFNDPETSNRFIVVYMYDERSHKEYPDSIEFIHIFDFLLLSDIG